MKSVKEIEQGQMEQNQNTGTQYVLLNKSENKSVYFKEVKDTPFTIIHDTSKGYTIVVGNQQVIRDFKKTEEECLALIKSKRWDILTTVMIITAEKIAESVYYKLKSKEDKQ